MRTCVLVVGVLCSIVSFAVADVPNMWINEFHYDNDGSDQGEFVELVVPEGTPFTEDITISLYNGSNGEVYETILFMNMTKVTTSDGFDIYTHDVEGIQNGPDGFCLDHEGTVVQFISYEGSFTAADGPATGMQSTDIGVQEETDTPVGYSLQLKGSGRTYDAFTWTEPAQNTKGYPNNDQALPVELAFFKARMVRNTVELSWRTETETNNLGFILDRRHGNDAWQPLASFSTHEELKGFGTTTTPHIYHFVDRRVERGLHYEYRLCDCDVNGTRGKAVTLAISVQPSAESLPGEFHLYQNYPNPFNPSTNIVFDVAEAGQVELAVYDMSGRLQDLLVDGYLEAGHHQISWNAEQVPAGVYLISLRAGTFRVTKKCVLLR